MFGHQSGFIGKILLFSVLFLVFMIAVSGALADGQVDPGRERMEQSLQEKQRVKEAYHQDVSPEDSGLNKGWNDNVSVTVSGTLAPWETLTFTANVTGVSDPSQLKYYWSVSDEGRDSWGYLYYPQYKDEDYQQTSIRYTFYSPGTYSCYLRVYNQNGGYIGYDYQEFVIPEDGVHPTLEQKAQQIVNSCRGADNWHTAVNLHDWLINNSYYDATFATHGADIIFLGYGVCDSYSKAYNLLCKTAGIPVERTFGPNHAWNTLQLGGEWYQVDCTWDDPGSSQPGQGQNVSGYEGYEYFCVNAAAMIPISSHSYEDGSQDGEHAAQCTSMDANYYIHENLWQAFGEYTWVYVNNDYIASTDPYVAHIQEQFNNGATAAEVTMDSYVYFMRNGNIEHASFQPSILQEIMKAGIAKQWFYLGSDAVKVNVSFSSQDFTILMAVKICGWDIEETGTLALPVDVKTVADQAFFGTAATRVVFPAGCGTIGNQAFGSSAVRTVVIPGPVTSISGSAFSGCGKIMFITTDPKVKTFAAEKGHIVVDP